METNFNIRLINGEIVESNENNHFFIVKSKHVMGGACGSLGSFLEYSAKADNIAVTSEYGNIETTKRVIPKANILEYIMKQ